MKAMLLSEYKKLDIVDMPTPEFAENELLIRVGACGICGSDIHGWDGSSGRRKPPLVMGHEAAGTIEAVGSAVTRFSEGERVTFDSMISCGKCPACKRGQHHLCENRQVMGVSCDEFRRHGAFAEYVVVPEHIAFRFPESLNFEHAAMVEPVSIAVHAANITPIRLGDTAIVVGSGMIGLLVVQAARLAGCSTVIAVDLDDAKLELAKSLGADATFNAETDDIVAEVMKLTGDYGADVSFEVVGATPTVKSAIECTRKGGAITLVGNLAPTVEFPLQSVVTRELRVQGSCASNGEYPQCIDYLSRGEMKVEPLITAMADLEEGPEWFARLYGGEPGAMKVLLKPGA
ncbi:MAG: galactitol-1-phosphate 5-dehydrogenase [Planctomycetota bacterium]|nr:galactitol-1-phosphate 5-dehydrogenase [Planctomycetota bacterium]